MKFYDQLSFDSSKTEIESGDELGDTTEQVFIISNNQMWLWFFWRFYFNGFWNCFIHWNLWKFQFWNSKKYFHWPKNFVASLNPVNCVISWTRMQQIVLKSVKIKRSKSNFRNTKWASLNFNGAMRFIFGQLPQTFND